MACPDNLVREFVEACHKVAALGLVQCSSGNMSRRIGPDTALLTASRSWLAEITDQQVAICGIQTGQCLNGKIPTCESVFHLGILKNRPDVNVVLHFQSPYATALACGNPLKWNYNVIIEVPVYIGIPAAVDYFPPGSPELAQAVIEEMKNPQTQLAFMKNHGLVAVGVDFNDVIQKAVFFELACQILLTNPNARPLPQEAADALRRSSKA